MLLIAVILFPVVIHADEIIQFADANVKAICVENWDINGDGELSKEEAAAVTDIGKTFENNTDITSFEEFQHFTGLKQIAGFAFSGCNKKKCHLTSKCVKYLWLCISELLGHKDNKDSRQCYRH